MQITYSPVRLDLHRQVRAQEAEKEAEKQAERERLALENERLARERTLESAVLDEFYQYKRIQEYYRSRVLVLNPGKKTDKLAGSLEAMWIGSEEPRYSALSYVWGEPQYNEVILIDGKRLAITNSLGIALRRLRPAPGQPALRIWIDQLCINQKDTVERSQQVRLMHAIFRDAHQVLVWLGADPEGHASRAFQLLNALRSIFEDKLLSTLCKLKGANFDWIPVENWKSLRELSKLPWFRRAWIPQEIGTDAEAIVHWGSESIRRFVEQPRDEPGGRARHSFVYQLCLSARNSATDPRDYVFSQLGHYSAWIEAEQALIIQPDYDNTIAAVYHEIAIRALTVDSTLMLLNSVSDNGEVRSPLPGPKELPSWVPRWDAGRFHSLIGHPGRYKASGSPNSCITKDSFEDNYKTLLVKGLVVDTIDKVTARFTSSCFNSDSPKKELIQAAWRLCRPPKPVPAFLDTLAPAALFDDISSPSNSSPSPKADDTAYASGISVLSKLFPAAAFSTKHDPRNWKPPSASRREATPTTETPKPNPTAWLQAAENHAVHRCFAVTEESRYFAMMPPTAKAGDLLCILQGGETPYVLRLDPKRDDTRLFVGEAYVPGLMEDASGLFETGMDMETFRLR
ncbi:hypothetical protein CHGG_09241 [Chaetomium globosum CBS 148.51]|uniref:Heterokaryon incompatibility domain-containing protein n=1 Tax=Chaetomium globosum (strain ATCC 6205 / CBS 148.51 / DSM 1962 / NBRC 6347 / NRRL 1970) TaxID=306901 RepID=Q2GS13_CHAGB|nr:uncharacterized protein CHGG_09241 [Chaetomium globosum CBS 148.51]EAQ85227.1 hypothetical protein CHGG_09241 [Chaetomium globosum CBS 148.51]